MLTIEEYGKRYIEPAMERLRRQFSTFRDARGRFRRPTLVELGLRLRVPSDYKAGE